MTNQKYILASLLIIVVTIGGAYYYIDKTFAAIDATLTEQLKISTERLQLVAEDVYRNRRAEGVNEYVRDCSPTTRAHFDSQFDRLSQLSSDELSETMLLFEACASFFADSKSASVAKLEDVYERFEAVVDVYSVVNGNVSQFNLDGWRDYIELQQQLADLLRQQIPLQAEIISQLMSGATASDESVQSVVTKAQELSESAGVINKQIDSLYTQIK